MVIGHPKTPLLLELNPWWYVGLWRVFWVKWPFIAISSPSRMQCLSNAAYLYPASFILYTPGSKADNVFCSRTQHNDPAGNCTPNFGSGVHTTAPGPPRFVRTRRTNNYTRPVCSLDKHRKLLVQSRNKHILHHWSILRWDLSSTHLKRNWKKNENKGKERKKKRNDSCHFCLWAGFDSCLTCFARAEGWSPQKWIVLIINEIKDFSHNNGSLSKKPLAMLTRTVR